ncbi:hypothetical protein C0Q70_08255 [Pomacea canaliculata]|uniref:Uncharacterized protein n=1 Tax=Pomacea canaliculata TaxID=400727 RepID=A0A2T7PHB3_POMCA|nr:hypothetical protein C0Q70_08255 [Pomacea canaliculata]
MAGNSSTDKAKTTTSLAQLVCRVGVVAPVNLDLYGLSDNASFWKTLEHARKEASEILRSVCSFEMHVHFTTCHFRTAVSASLNVSYDSEALIGPPCSSAVTRVAGLLGKPVLSWVPLVDSKGEEDGSSDENADVDDHPCSSY